MTEVGEWFTQNVEVIGLVVGLVVGLVGIVLAVYYGRQAHGQQSKTLDWTLKTDEEIVGTAAQRVGSELTVAWANHPLKRPRLVVLRIQNTGKREIVESDYDLPITVSIPDTRIISATVTAVSHERVYKLGWVPMGPLTEEEIKWLSVDTPVEWGVTSIILKPKLLNADDWIELQLLVDGEGGLWGEEFEEDSGAITTRFAGQTRPMWANLEVEDSVRSGRFYIFIIGLVLGTALTGTGYFLGQDAPLWLKGLVLVLFGAAAWTFGRLYGIISNLAKR